MLSPDKDGQCLHNVGASTMKIKKRAADERKNRSEQCRAQASLPLRGTAPESWSTACGRGSQECL